jgi:hypothetical protein
MRTKRTSPIAKEEKPNKSWSPARLVAFVREQQGVAQEAEAKVALYGRASALASWRAGWGLDLLGAKLLTEHAYNDFLRKEGIGRTRAWEDRELYRRCQSKDVIAGLTKTEAKRKFGILRTPGLRRQDNRPHDAAGLLPMSDYRVYCCTMQKLPDRARLDPHSLDLALADLPYDQGSIPLYDEVGAFCRTYVKPGHLLLAQVGSLYWLDAGVRLKDSGLEPLPPFQIQFANTWQAYKLNQVRMRMTARLVLVFSNGPYDRDGHSWVDTSVDGYGPEKDADRWQSNVDDLAYWIHRLTMPGDLVAALAGGVFSEGVCCRRLGRRFVGCDPSAKKCETGLRRMDAVQGVHVGPVFSRWRG